MKKMKYSKILFALIIFCLVSCEENSDLVKIQCSYMAYACDDCTPQFRVDSISSYDNEKHAKYLGMDVKVFVVNENSEKVLLKDLLEQCRICYNYHLEGRFSTSVFSTHLYFNAISYGKELKFQDCCD